MIAADFHRKLLQATDWWMVRGESGSLWSALFEPHQVVAHGRLVKQFAADLDYGSRQRAMLALDDFDRREVDDFIDVMDIGHIVVTPDEGSRAAWLGIVTSDWFPDYSCEHWMQRRCAWFDSSIPLIPEASDALRKGPKGTVFNVLSHASALCDSFTRAMNRPQSA